MLSGYFPWFCVSHIHRRRFVFLFSMVCVEGVGWAGVKLRDKVAVFRWILFVFVGDGPADRASTRVSRLPEKTCRQEWRHGTSGDVRHVACPQLSCSTRLFTHFWFELSAQGRKPLPHGRGSWPTFRLYCSRRGSVFRFAWRGAMGCTCLKPLSLRYICFYVTDRAGFGFCAWRPNTWQARMAAVPRTEVRGPQECVRHTRSRDDRLAVVGVRSVAAGRHDCRCRAGTGIL